MTHPHLEGLIETWHARGNEWARIMGGFGDDEEIPRLIKLQIDVLDRCRHELETAIAALPGGGVDEGVASLGHVSGHLSKAIEVMFAAGTPEWLRQPGMRVYVTGEPLLRAIGRSGEGHSADWCAGWNACLVATSRGDIPLSTRDADEAMATRAARVVCQRAGEDWDSIGALAQGVLIDTQLLALTAALSTPSPHEADRNG